VNILKRAKDGDFELEYAVQAHSAQVDSVALDNSASRFATVCSYEGKVKLWDVKQGMNVCITLTSLN
jgi:hypothetical protein